MPISPTSLQRSQEAVLADPRQQRLLAVIPAPPLPAVAIDGIERLLIPPPARRTLQRWLNELTAHQLVERHGEKRGARYALKLAPGSRPGTQRLGLQVTEPYIRVSEAGASIRDAVRLPAHLRKPVGHEKGLLDNYEPNVTYYLSQELRQGLLAMGSPPADTVPAAGTFANDILDRLLIDLSYASSHLEGNTYSRLDTMQLLEKGQAAEGKAAIETQMILNHKEAIEFLVHDASCTTVNPSAIKSLHALLSDGLMHNDADVGRLRNRGVEIAGSVYKPLASGLAIEAEFGMLIEKAAAILDPFEQALFLMVQLPYLQPFMDVNKRVSRLAANIPLVQANLGPLSFIDVPVNAYIDATLGVYELNRVDLLRDVFLFAYERSCQQYTAAKQSLRPPDPFRNRYRRQIGAAIKGVVQADLPADVKSIALHVPEEVPAEDRERFQYMVADEIAATNPDSAIRFGLRPLEFDAWLKAHRKA